MNKNSIVKCETPKLRRFLMDELGRCSKDKNKVAAACKKLGENNKDLFLEWYSEKKNLRANNDWEKANAYDTEEKAWTVLKSLLKKKSSKAIVIIEEEEEEEKEELNKVVEIAEDDEHAAKILLKRLGNNMKYSNGQYYFKEKNIWSANRLLLEKQLIAFIQESGIYKLNSKGENVPYAQNYSSAKNIYKSLLGKVEPDEDFHLKLHESTKGMLCFNDGVLNLIENKFCRWSKLKIEVYSCVKINRDFEAWFLSPDETIVKKVEEKIFDAMFETSHKVKFLRFMSRAFAGHIEDKDWACFLGNRNNGKGVMEALCRNALGDYVGSVDGKNLMCDKGGKQGDCAKALSYLIDMEFVRLAFSQEMDFDKKNVNVRLNSILIKKWASGGDKFTGRKNYQDEYNFYIDAKLILLLNDMPPFSNSDVEEHLVQFNSTKQFKDKAWIENRRQLLNEDISNGADEQVLLELEQYTAGDDTVKKTARNNNSWGDGLITLLLRHYCKDKLVMEHDAGNDDCGILVANILKRFTITGDKGDKITNKLLKEEIFPAFDICDSYKKFRLQLLSIKGVEEYREATGRGINGLKYKMTE